MSSLVLPRRFRSEGRVSDRVILAHDRFSGLPVAVKVASALDAEGVAELAREFELLAAFDHPALPRAVDFGRLDDDRAYLALERGFGDVPLGPLSQRELAILVEGLGEAVELLHSRGLLHRDLKPSNVLLDATSDRVLLLDLGLAQPPGIPGEVRGTVGFMAPEAAAGRAVDARADIYSFGALLHHAATGVLPFPGTETEILAAQREGRFEPLARRRADLPGSFCSLVGALLEPDPDRRPADVADVRARLVEALSGAQRAYPPLVPTPAFVGRERELRQLGEAADLAREQTVKLAVLGRSGAGCSRLLREAWSRWRLEGRVTWLRSARGGETHPLRDLAEDLGLLLDSGVDPGPSTDVVPAALAALTDAVAQLRRRGAGGLPLVLLVDDLHRADPAIRQDVASLWHAVDGLPVLLVTAHSPDCWSGWPPPNVACVELGAMTESESTELAGSALRAPVPQPVVQWALRNGGRLPRRLLDLLRGQVESGRIVRLDGSWRLVAPLEEPRPAGPGRRGELQLAPEARRIAAALVALDGPATLGDLSEMAEVPPRDVMPAARTLVAQGLAILEGASLVPTDAAATDLADMLPAEELRAMHDRVVDLHDDSPPESSRALRLAEGEAKEVFRLRHRARGGDPEIAVAACARLGQAQLVRGALALAARNAALGLGRLGEVPAEAGGDATLAVHEVALHGVLAEVEERAGRHHAAAEARRRQVAAARLCGDATALREGLHRLGRVLLRSGDVDEAVASLDEALSLADAGPGLSLASRNGTARASLLIDRAEADARLSRPEDAESRLAEAGFLSCDAGDRVGEARVMAARGRFARQVGRYDEARELLRRGIERLEEEGEDREAARALTDLGWTEYLAGDHRRAATTLRTALNLAEKLGDQRAMAGVLNALGAVSATGGRPSEAVAHHRQALVASRQCGDLLGQLAAANNLGWQLFVSGDVPGAITAFREVLDLRAQVGGAGSSAMTLNNLGVALCAGAEYAEALERCEQAREAAREAGDRRTEAEACWGLGRVYGALGAMSDGLRWQEEALSLATAMGNPLDRAYALTEMGALLVRAAELKRAAECLAEGRDEALKCGEQGVAALAELRLGAVQALRGELGVGHLLLREGLARARSSGDRLAELEGLRLLGTLLCDLGAFDEGLASLREALDGCSQSGFVQELPSVHAGLAAGHLRRALRLKTTTGAVVDRAVIEEARAHLERGLDRALASGRMADRGQLRLLAASALLTLGEAEAAEAELAEAKRLAAETGDRLALARAGLVEAEALLARREFGEALGASRRACEELTSIGLPEDRWRVHSLIGRIHGAWGMAEREAQEARHAELIIRELGETLDDEALAKSFRSDVLRRHAASPPPSPDGSRRRRVLPATLRSERFAGHVDPEDLVESLLAERERLAGAEAKAVTSRRLLRQATARRRLLEELPALLDGDSVDDGALRSLLRRVLAGFGGERAFFVESAGGRMRVRAAADRERETAPLSSYSLSVGVIRQAMDRGRGVLSGDARRDQRFGGMSSVRALDLRSLACAPVAWDGQVRGALYVDNPVTERAFRQRDLRTLVAVAAALGHAIERRGMELSSATPVVECAGPAPAVGRLPS